ncbi:MAG TPA: glycoside hydrolase family 2 TIM barrel-domain containing protein [Arachidicoccus sp.]|nr:glycoside hydrolase family 2 TIM barrel-domain containing protein [Arachidicoccus sp.]
MKRKYFMIGLLLCIIFTGVIQGSAQIDSSVVDLSQNNWSLCLDTAAKWEKDKLYAPPVNIDEVPIHLPTGGWQFLTDNPTAKTVHLPATVEEYFWGANGDKFGVSGNYLGVSWFSTKVNIPTDYKNKRVVLKFESVRFRAEVFVNRKLVAYDLVNSTPFDVDISKVMIAGAENEIDVRITDPNGNFDWRDSQNFMWGDYRTQPTHGFGGITGKVLLEATDPVFINDVFVKNKAKPTEVDVQLSGENRSGKVSSGHYQFEIKAYKTGKVVYTHQYPATLQLGANTTTFTINLPNAGLWDVDHPNLYLLTVMWKGSDGTADTFIRRFGFRWFEIRNINGDKQFFLNGKRIVLRTSISWGFWPVNGIAPSDELARKQVMDAKRLGLNMLNFHRTIGQANVLDAADELGLLYFEEPGGNQYPERLFQPQNDLEKMQTDYYLAVRNEKFFRMIRRDRNHPALVIYNMHNERGAQPQPIDRAQMRAGHQLDETRIITYNSCNGNIKINEPDPKFKLHLLPYDTTFYDYGWFDQHHAGGPGVYHDNLYNNPTSYAKYTDHKNEIIYYGEEGAIGTPPRLQLIRDEIMKRGKDIGWESDTYLKWYDAYDHFLHNNGFLKAFPNVDSLTRKMGNVAYYYQGRVIENVRINNTIDGYAINGWEGMKQENHSGMVDNYRNLKGDPDLIARYNKPLYIAVKLNHKVVPVGNIIVADFYIVNEKNIRGAAELEIQAKDQQGDIYFAQKQKVTVAGGNVYGQLLVAGIEVPVQRAGYTTISAILRKKSHHICSGDDNVYAVKFDKSGVSESIQVADTTGTIQSYLRSVGIEFRDYHSGRPDAHVLVIGAYEPRQTGNPLVTDILEWVNSGNKLVIVSNTEKWAMHLAKKEVIDFRGIKVMGTSWYGGNYFVRSSPLFAGLPENCVFNWEYQCLATYNKNRIGMRMFNGQTIVGCVSDHKQEVYSALSVIAQGRGKIIVNALDIISCIKNAKVERPAEGDGENASVSTINVLADNPANVVARQLLLNMLKD